MADFCNKCARDIGLPEFDFAEDTTIERRTVLCEGCGFVDVDRNGEPCGPLRYKSPGLDSQADR